ncbi:MAG: hypothetical protein KC620_10145 [Myxococcales bacterium]|nr:hypothetical protein [Myxococcales bacterium]
MTAPSTVGRHVRSFLHERGDQVLTALGERPYRGAAWSPSSHGAVIRAHGEHDDLFERLVVVLPRPADAPADRFRPWGERRLQHLGWYMERCNTGKLVRVMAREHAVMGVFMQRVGRDPNDPQTELPPPDRVPALLLDFATHLELYVRNLGDDELRYVRALRLFRVPRHQRPDDFVLGVDVLPTVIGLAEQTIALSPPTLVRGVIGELAEVLDQRREALAAEATLRTPIEWWRARKQARVTLRVVDQLDQLCTRIDERQPDLPSVRAWLEQITPAPNKRRRWPIWPLLVLIAASAVATSWLLR